MLKAVIFDFDGVIVDSEPLHYQAFLRVVEGLGIHFDYAHYLQRYVGFDDRDGFRAILAEAAGTSIGPAADDDLIARLCQEKAQAFGSVVASGCQPLPGVLELIEETGRRMPIAIASGATRQDISPILDKLGLGEQFNPVITADDVARSKPDPATYALAVGGLAKRRPDLEIAPADCLAIEDTPAGIESARRAGVRTLGVATTYPAQALVMAHRVVGAIREVTVEKLDLWYG